MHRAWPWREALTPLSFEAESASEGDGLLLLDDAHCCSFVGVFGGLLCFSAHAYVRSLCSKSSSSYSTRTAHSELVSPWSSRILTPEHPSCLAPTIIHTQHPGQTKANTSSQSSSCPRITRRWCWSRGGRAWWARGSRTSPRLVRSGLECRKGDDAWAYVGQVERKVFPCMTRTRRCT